MIWSPTGSPSDVTPAGTEQAALPQVACPVHAIRQMDRWRCSSRRVYQGIQAFQKNAAIVALFPSITPWSLPILCIHKVGAVHEA